MKIIRFIIIVLLAVFWSIIIKGYVHAACSGSSPSWTCTTQSDLASLVGGTSLQDGDTVTVSASGTWTYVTPLTITKRIRLIGPGTDGGGNWLLTLKENIVCNTTTPAGCTNCGLVQFRYTTPNTSGYTTEMSGFKVDGGNTTHALVITNNNYAYPDILKIHDNFWYNSPDNLTPTGGLYIVTLSTYGYFTGVIYKNYGYPNPVYHINGYLDDEGRDAFRYLKHEPGTANNLYIEDEYFDHDGDSGSYQFIHLNFATRTVVRYNTFRSNAIRNQVEFIWIHDTDVKPGPLNVEIYGNEFISTATSETAFRRDTPVNHLGGPLFNFNNKLSSTITGLSPTTRSYNLAWNSCTGTGTFTEKRAINYVGTRRTLEAVCWKYDTITKTWGYTGQPLWECPSVANDPMGEYESHGNIAVCEITGGACSAGADGTVKVPMHTWRSYNFQNYYNTTQGSATGSLIPTELNYLETYCKPDGGRIVPLEEKQWFQDNASCTASSCANGIGCGSSVPIGTCDEGTAYWKSNTCSQLISGSFGQNPTAQVSGTLYRCSSSNTWTAYYTPLSYPYPSRSTPTPVISSYGPSTIQSCSVNPQPVTLYAATDIDATCKYHPTITDYDSMWAMDSTGGTSHSTGTTDTCGTTPSYQVKCKTSSEAQSAPVTISYSVASAVAGSATRISGGAISGGGKLVQ